jgi:hypothetical protein
MSKGVVGTLQLAASAVVVVPVAAFSLFKFAEGEPLLGVLFLAIAALVVVVEESVTSPSDLPAVVVEEVGGRVLKRPDDEE